MAREEVGPRADGTLIRRDALARRVHPWLKMLLGGGIALTGLPVALLLAAVLLLGECPETCIPARERGWGALAAAGAAALGAAGVALVVKGWREERAGAS